MNFKGFGLIAILFCVCFLSKGWTQTEIVPENESAPVAPTVRDIRIEFGELKNVDVEVVMAHVQIKENQPYDQNLVDRSIRSLYKTGLFDFVEAKTLSISDEAIDVIFSVKSRYRIQDIRFEGNHKIKKRKFRDKVSLRPGFILSEYAVNKDREGILEYYKDKGYTSATVDYRITRNTKTGLGTVVFEIYEGPKIKIKKIEFIGNEVFSDRELRKQMETRRRWFMSWLTGSGRFDETTFQEDLDRLRAFYKEEGYLDVDIDESNVRIEYPKPTQMKIFITVNEGRLYRVGNIEVEGEEIFDELMITRSLHMIPGDHFSPKKLQEDVQRIQDLYGSVGYLDARVRSEKTANMKTGALDLVYRIHEGDKYYVESIDIQGNTKTRSVVILRELALSPGRVFNKVWMKNSEARLNNTGFFEEVSLAPESTNIPGRKNLKVTVSEGRTGQFQLGAGFSSLESVVLFFEISQGNFDLFNWRSFFQGDGQKFRFKVSVGSDTSEIILALEEPWFMDQRLALGFEASHSASTLNSSYYDEIRTGIKVYMRKRLFELVDGELTYQYEIVNLDNMSTSASSAVQAEAGKRSVSKVTLNIGRDTRNHFIFTTQGSRLNFSTTFAGIGGDTKYIKFETRNAVFLPLFDTGDQVLSVLARAGTFWEYAGEDVPLFDRFYLGGPNSLRGFDYRDVGPQDDEDYIGGNAYAFTSLEYTVKLGDPLRFAVFYDWGFVNKDDFDFGSSYFNDNWGIGIRLLVLGNPLRLDYGIPIHSYTNPDTGESNDTGNQLNFSFGTRF